MKFLKVFGGAGTGTAGGNNPTRNPGPNKGGNHMVSGFTKIPRRPQRGGNMPGALGRRGPRAGVRVGARAGGGEFIGE